MRIVIDGTAGCGKTTFLTGSSTIYPDEKQYYSIRDIGYTVFSELIRGTIRARKVKCTDPFSDLTDFFNIAMERALEFYKNGDGEDIYFYDRGIPYLEIMSARYGYKMPDKYYELCANYRYDSPVFVFAPIQSLDMRFPKPNEDKGKGYTLEERLIQHQKVIEVYNDMGYSVIEVPVFDDGDPERNNEMRRELLREHIVI